MNQFLKLVQLRPHYWVLEFPPVVWKNEPLFLSAYPLFDTDPKRAETIYRQVLANCGEQYIDANVHLGMLLNKHGAKGTGTMYIIQAFLQARKLFPDEFVTGEDRLPWECINNRHILHAYHAMGLELVKVKKLGEARELFEFLLQINPTDEQGAAAWKTKIEQAIDKLGGTDFSANLADDFFKHVR